MKILALNSGSSSIKYRIYDSNNHYQLLDKGIAERIDKDYQKALHTLFPKPLDNIDAVGHRVVHGGERFKDPTLLDEGVIKEIANLAEFAPLHCEPNVTGIIELQKLLPNVPHVAIFDTSTHAKMQPKAFLYGLPYEYYEKHKIRKYGFHGINHAYIAHEAARLIHKPLYELKMITCHLGNGCSLTAFEKGKSIDNTMGFTPLEGLIMGTRCGDLDPSVVLYLIEKFRLDVNQTRELLNKKSGLLGLSGKSDMRDIIELAKKGNTSAQIAIDAFVYRIQKYIGAYIAALNGVDAIVFSAGIGENSPYIRSLIIKNFSYVGAHVDSRKNDKNDPIFSSNDSSITLLNIPANEELAIAQLTHHFLNQNK